MLIKFKVLLAVGVALVLAVAVQRVDLRAQAGGKNVWDGVFTAEQAARGKTTFMTYCASCHGETGEGTPNAPRTKVEIVAHWEEATLNDLFVKVRTTMPRDQPSTLADPTYIDAIAYVLQLTGFPAGSQELAPTPDLLKSVAIWSAKEGPSPPKTGTLVRAIGCLTPGAAANTWTLANSTAPKRSRLSTPSVGEELQAARATPLGAATVGLAAFPPTSAANSGRKMEAKGLLVKLPAGDRISIMSLALLDEQCPVGQSSN